MARPRTRMPVGSRSSGRSAASARRRPLISPRSAAAKRPIRKSIRATSLSSTGRRSKKSKNRYLRAYRWWAYSGPFCRRWVLGGERCEASKMNTSLPVPNEGPWPVGAYNPDANQLGGGQRHYSSANVLDFATLLRIVHHWRWLVLGAVALGLAAAILATLLTRPVYRAWVTLEANPPSFQVTDEKDGDPAAMAGPDTSGFVATQVGLVQSRSVAERAAQELNLPNNPDIVPQDVDASTRLRLAAMMITKNLSVTPPDVGELIKFSYDSTSPQLAASIANAVADSFINTAIQ